MTPMSMYIYITVKSLSYIQCSKTIVKHEYMSRSKCNAYMIHLPFSSRSLTKATYTLPFPPDMFVHSAQSSLSNYVKPKMYMNIYIETK